jgi:integrase
MARTSQTDRKAPPYFHLSETDGHTNWRVIVQIPAAARPYLPPPHTGKRKLVKSLKTGCLAQAIRYEREHQIIRRFEVLRDRAIAASQNMATAFAPVNAAPQDDAEQIFSYTNAGELIHIERRTTLPAGERVANPNPNQITFDEIIDGYKLERSAGTDKPISDKFIKDMRTTITLLKTKSGVAFPYQLTIEHIRAFKRHLLESGAASKTIGNHRIRMKAFWKHAVANGVSGDRNLILEGFEYKVMDGVKRRDFTNDEANTILNAASIETAPVRRWIPLILAYTGARVGELTGSAASAIQQRQGVWCLVVQDGTEQDEPVSTRLNGATLKTDESNKVVPLAQAILDSGFIEYAQKRTGALFPNCETESRRETTTAWLRDWVWRVLGKKPADEPRLSPNHSWRHSVESKLVNLGISDHIAWTITGRAIRGSAAGYRHATLATLKATVDQITY